MESFYKFLDRFIRLLPFLAGPFCYRRFHYEWFYPYPDVWNGPDDPPALFAAPSGTSARQQPSSGAGRARFPRHPVGHHARPYLTWVEMNSWGHHGGEPFW